MALFQRQDANQQSLFLHPVPHVHGPNTLDSNAGPSSFPPRIAPSSHPQLRIPPNVNNPRMNPPTFNGAALNPEPLHPFEMNPLVISHPVVNQPAFNHPSSFIHHAANSVAFTGQQSQGQTLNPPNLYHPPLLEFTFVLEYMGERIGIQTDQPTRFQILHLCNIASSALHNEYSPANHIFRPMVAPRWLGRVLRVHSDALLRVIVHQCISRGEFRLHIWVYFIRDGHPHPSAGSLVNSGTAEFPVMVDFGAVPHPQVAPGHPQSMPLPSVQHDAHGAPPVPPLVPNPIHPQQAQNVAPVISNPGDARFLGSAPGRPANAVSMPISIPTPCVPIVQTVLSSGPDRRWGDLPNDAGVIAAAGGDQSNDRRKYKCQNCGSVGHSKRTCKVVNPILTKATVAVSREVETVVLNSSDEGGRAGPSGDAEVQLGLSTVTADHLTPSTISKANGHSNRPTSSLCEVVFRSDEIMTRGKHYVIFVGRIPGVYGSWAECQRQVIRFSGNSYQSYSTREEAEEAFEAFRRSEVEIILSGLELDPVNGNRQRPLEGQLQEAITSAPEDKLSPHGTLVILLIVIICAVVMKILWFSECEDGWADDEGDEVAMVNIPMNQQEGEQCDQFELHTNIHGNSGTDQEGTNYRGLKSMDIVGKEFVSEAEAKSFFIEYARVMGFGVRRHNKRRNTKGKLIGRIWVCSRQGFRQKKFVERENRKREARPITRTGCGVEFRVAIKDDTSRWVCTHFNGNHNHNLTPPHHVHYIRSHRRLSEADISTASSLNAVGMRPSQIHEYMVERSGGYRDVGYLRKDVQNRLDYEKRRQLQEYDAEACLSYLEGKRSVDPAFYYDFTINEHNRLGDLFWCDGGARADYALFGDVLAFDATYRTNAYRKPFVVLLGINHHRRSIVFGFALLSDETEHTYTWLLQTFLLAMEGKQPKTVITDGDKAMRNAISNKFSDAHHRLCCWHLSRNAQANVNKDFTTDFRQCMLRPYTEERFEMDRLIDRQREVEGKDDYDSKEARPVLITHMKPFEAAAAEAYTRAMFRLKVSEDECRVHIQGTWDTVSCTCLMMETVGIPCSHLFAVMKVENLEAIPRCMILPRWKKEAKVGVTSEVQERCSQHYMSIEARMGSLHAACRTLQRFAAQSSQAYELAITEIHKVSMQLEAMSCETAKDKPKRHMGRRFEVQDPVIVLTKGCRKK
ncbi:protein FAR1-RELATED SEQUENCE 5 [Citrus sinensis]|uniref:Protein FAR1-RELATED SEQUENCE 5 n=1 Tax=Citrus sinensis TaxID=2711 RepID=A0ACB8IMW9_CITSI|nr:protein FAR1-RELATED SEQUENCE 5 [Citrus sinensis]